MTIDYSETETGGTHPIAPESYGRAALLLVESLIHGLCEKGTLGTRDAVEIAERAVIVQLTQAAETEGEAASLWQSHALLSAIAESLKIDDIGEPSPPRLVS